MPVFIWVTLHRGKTKLYVNTAKICFVMHNDNESGCYIQLDGYDKIMYIKESAGEVERAIEMAAKETKAYLR